MMIDQRLCNSLGQYVRRVHTDDFDLRDNTHTVIAVDVWFQLLDVMGLMLGWIYRVMDEYSIGPFSVFRVDG